MAALPVVDHYYKLFDPLFTHGLMKVVGKEGTVFEGGHLDKALLSLWQKLLEKCKETYSLEIGAFLTEVIPLVRDSGEITLNALAAVQALPDKEKKITKMDRFMSKCTESCKEKLETLEKNVELDRVLTVLLDVVNNYVAKDSKSEINVLGTKRKNVMEYFKKVGGKWKLNAEAAGATNLYDLLKSCMWAQKELMRKNIWEDAGYANSDEFKKWREEGGGKPLETWVKKNKEKWDKTKGTASDYDVWQANYPSSEWKAKLNVWESEHGKPTMAQIIAAMNWESQLRRPMTMAQIIAAMAEEAQLGTPMTLSDLKAAMSKAPKKARTGYDNELNLDYGGYQQPPQYQVEHYPYFDGYGSSRRQDVMVLPPQSNGYYVMPPDQFAVGGMAPAYSAYQDNALLLVLLMLVLALFGCVCLCASAAIGWFSGRKSVQDRGSKVWSPIAQEVDEV